MPACFLGHFMHCAEKRFVIFAKVVTRKMKASLQIWQILQPCVVGGKSPHVSLAFERSRNAAQRVGQRVRALDYTGNHAAVLKILEDHKTDSPRSSRHVFLRPISWTVCSSSHLHNTTMHPISSVKLSEAITTSVENLSNVICPPVKSHTLIR